MCHQAVAFAERNARFVAGARRREGAMTQVTYSLNPEDFAAMLENQSKNQPIPSASSSGRLRILLIIFVGMMFFMSAVPVLFTVPKAPPVQAKDYFELIAFGIVLISLVFARPLGRFLGR